MFSFKIGPKCLHQASAFVHFNAGCKSTILCKYLSENAVSVSAEKVAAPIPILKFNPGFGSRYLSLISVGLRSF